jgi:homoserine dehydrogenase
VAFAARSQWRIGVAGLGSVGGALVGLIGARPGFSPTGATCVVAGVCARSKTMPRAVDISPFRWFDDPVVLAESPDNDIFVELVGGAEGPAKAAVEAALRLGKPVVTANKALIAAHGLELARLAEANGAPLLFEAAVMGGTPAVKILREALVGDEVQAVAGILNGTCNYILTQMEATGRAFSDVLAEAQALGYAEADPTMDIGGFDAAHKIAILAALAFGGAPSMATAEIEGLEAVELLDIHMAKDLGYRIKLVASASRSASGVSVRTHPALTPLDHPLARTDGVLNALFIQTRGIGRIFIQGPGAGGAATAAAVAADLSDIMTGASRPVFQAPAESLRPFSVPSATVAVGRVYVRLLVRDEPGVIASISETLAEAGVSIDSFLQKPVQDAGGVPIVLTTHDAPAATIAEAMQAMAALPSLIAPPRLIRIADI